MIDRYARQTLFPQIGQKGQEKLLDSYVVIIGCGALGTMIATALTRAGVGKIRIVDRDFIEYHNLQRQVLFEEDDIVNKIPKAIAAQNHLRKVNSDIEIDGVVADVNYTNIEQFISGSDLILDGLDNFESRFLINDAALKHNIPWVYGGAISTSGMTMNIIPGKTPCFRCIFENDSKKYHYPLKQFRKYKGWDLLPNIITDCLVVGASKDRMHYTSEKTAKIIPNATFVDLETNKATHDQPLLDVIDDYVNQMNGR